MSEPSTNVTAGISAFFEAYPGAKTHNLRAIAAAWHALKSTEQSAAIEGIEPFRRARRDAGLKGLPTGATYLKGGYWRTQA